MTNALFDNSIIDLFRQGSPHGQHHQQQQHHDLPRVAVNKENPEHRINLNGQYLTVADLEQMISKDGDTLPGTITIYNQHGKAVSSKTRTEYVDWGDVVFFWLKLIRLKCQNGDLKFQA